MSLETLVRQRLALVQAGRNTLSLEETARDLIRLARKDARRPRRPRRRAKIVCISGSTRFIDEMAVAAWELEKQGIIAIGPHLLPQSYPGVQPHHQAEAEGLREVLDELHLRKIDLADEIYVVNPGGYIGESTTNELLYAQKKGVPIRWMVPPPDPDDWQVRVPSRKK